MLVSNSYCILNWCNSRRVVETSTVTTTLFPYTVVTVGMNSAQKGQCTVHWICMTKIQTRCTAHCYKLLCTARGRCAQDEYSNLHQHTNWCNVAQVFGIFSHDSTILMHCSRGKQCAFTQNKNRNALL